MHEWTTHIIRLVITTLSLRTNKLIYFFPVSLTQDTMRRIVWGCWKKVTGSKAPPAFPAPYACIPSMVLLLAAQPPLWSSPPPRRWFKCTGCVERRATDTEYPRIRSFYYYRRCSEDGCSSLPGSLARSLQCSLVVVFFVFYLTSKSPVVLPRYPGTGRCGICQYFDDALSLSTQEPVANKWTRFRCHASDGALLVWNTARKST